MEGRLRRISLGLILCGLAVWMKTGHSGEFTRTLYMVARNWVFEPSRLEVCAGERIRLVIETRDRKHGFQLKAVGVKVKLLKGSTQAIEFTAPEKPGAYPFKCAHYCGRGHRRMRGVLVVKSCPTRSG